MNDQQQQHACLFEALEYQEPLNVIQTIVEMLPHCVRIRRQSSLPLHVACEKGNSLEVIHFLVQVFPESVSIKDGNECLPLHLACNNPHCNTEMVQFLVKKYPKALSMPNRMGFLPIHFACMNNTVETVRYLIQKCPGSVDCHDQQQQQQQRDIINNKNGYTLLHVACKGTRRMNSLEMIQFLLEEYPDMVSTPNRNGCLPLYFFLNNNSSSSSSNACCHEREAAVLAALINANPFTLFAKTAWGDTPLQFCRKHRPTLYHTMLKDKAETLLLIVQASRERLQQVAAWRHHELSEQVVQSEIWTYLVPDFALSALAYTTTVAATSCSC